MLRLLLSACNADQNKSLGVDGMQNTTLEHLPDLSTRKEIAEVTQFSIPTLARWSVEGKGPRSVRIGRAIRYRKQDVLEWLDSLAG